MTLTEVVIAVAITGILAGIAVPSYQFYRNKSKQSQAVAELSSLYSSEKMFNSQWNSYTSRFDAIGYRPEGELNYRIAFSGDFAPPLTDPQTGTATCITTAGPPVCTYPVTWTNAWSSNNAGVTPATTIGGTWFAAVAIGNINGAAVDSWSVNEKFQLKNVPAL